MKITLVGPVYPYRGGIAHYTSLLVRALLDHGHQVKVISFKRQYPTWLYPGGSDRDPSQQPMRIEAEYLLDYLYPWSWWQTARRITCHTPDLVILPWWTTFWGVQLAVLVALLRKRSIPIVFLIHNVLPHEGCPWDKFLARLALRGGNAFIVQTEREKDKLLSLLPAVQVQVCAHPVYTMLTKGRIPKQQARDQLSLPVEKPVLLFFGIVRPYKGLRVLLEALGQLRQRGLSPILLVAGEFWEDSQLYQEQMEQLGIQDQVRLDNRYIPDEEASVMFSAADALVAPYVDGTQSGAAEIALGFGLPLIVSEIVAQGIVEQNRKSTRIVPPGDTAALAEAIESFITQPPLEYSPVPAEDDWGRLVLALEQLSQQMAAEA